MRKSFRSLSLLLAALLMGSTALAEVSFDGQVIASETVAVGAPFGGLVDSVALRVGDSVSVGDPVAAIATTKVYATADGTVSGIFAREGDDTEGVVSRHGAVVYIEPVNSYIISATTEKASNSSGTK